MGINTSRIPVNIIMLQEFEASPDVSIYIGITEVVFLMPIFRKCDDRWVDATGDYDLCMSFDQTKFEFISRRPAPTIYGYRFFSTNWLATRSLQ